MTRAEIQNCTMEDAWELAEFARDNGICVLEGYEVSDIYDLHDDLDNLNLGDSISDMLSYSSIKVIYDYIKQAVEGNSRFVWEVKGLLVPFTEEDLEQLKEAVLEWMD